MTHADRVTCLVVDDLPENILALSALLRDDAVEVLTARSGPEALELLLVHDVAVAFIDVQMPEMDGFELAEVMRGSERTRAVPIIFVTAGARDQQRVFKGYDSGAVDFIFKPIEPHVLRSKAEVFFRLQRQSRELARQLHERTETLKLNEMFVAVLGHDLRGPLSAILMSGQVLANRPDEATRATGARLQRSARWMGRMIEDMIDLTRARLGGGIPVRRAPVDLGLLLENVVADRRQAHPDRRLDYSSDGSLAGEWDADRLAQVWTNLVGNALAHGDASRAVTVCADGSQRELVEVTVTNGGAVPAELRPVVFDPFRSGRQHASRAQGLGLGLYIVREIALAHGGSVVLETSDDADTTTFRVSLPRR